MSERKLNRLKYYDYSIQGYYFVTICTNHRIERFGHIRHGKMFLNKYGRIVYEEWLSLGERYPYVQIEEFIVMPNHLHSILVIDCFLEQMTSHGRPKAETRSPR
jgi:putative transposase